MIDGVVKIKREIEDMVRFEEEEMKKIRPIINTWYDQLSNYILNPIRKSVSLLKDKFIRVFLGQICLNKLFLREDRNQANQENKILKGYFLSEENKKKLGIELLDIWKLFETEEEKDERKMQEHNE